MASGDQGTGTGRRTGVAPRAGRTPRRPQRTQRDWLAIAAIASLGVVVLVVLAAMVGGGPSGPVATRTPLPTTFLPTYSPEPTRKPTPGTPTPSPSPKPTPMPTPTPSPTPTLKTSPLPTPVPTASPTPMPTLSPTPAATPTLAPIPTPTDGATPPAAGLVILDLFDGQEVFERVIAVRGLVPPGSTVTRDIPMWFDEHTVADAAGRWSFAVTLNAGPNVLTFRVGDDATTTITLTVTYRQT